MAKVFLITGFNNWGKTTIIKKLFQRQRFYRKTTYSSSSLVDSSGKKPNFCVQPHSNDDIGAKNYINNTNHRKPIKPAYILSAFCPTRELSNDPKLNNDSREIINKLFKNDDVYIIALEYKWCGHAKLELKKINNYLNLGNVFFHAVSQPNNNKVTNDVASVINPLL